MPTGYREDFYSWAREQADALREAGHLRPNLPRFIDWENLAEEIQDLGNEQESKLESAYRGLLIHLLKWQFQPDQRSSFWRGSIVEHRRRALKLIAKNPGLKPHRDELFAGAYEDARAQAAAETELPEDMFPGSCPYTLEQALGPNFLPEATTPQPA